jgi:hypothetical protein
MDATAALSVGFQLNPDTIRQLVRVSQSHDVELVRVCPGLWRTEREKKVTKEKRIKTLSPSLKGSLSLLARVGF